MLLRVANQKPTRRNTSTPARELERAFLTSQLAHGVLINPLAELVYSLEVLIVRDKQ